MQRIRVVLASLGVLVVASQATAVELWPRIAGRCHWPQCVGSFTCDCFQSKPLPCTHGVNCFECPSYCRPPLPCTVSAPEGCFDDYCRKPLPPACGLCADEVSGGATPFLPPPKAIRRVTRVPEFDPLAIVRRRLPKASNETGIKRSGRHLLVRGRLKAVGTLRVP
jgi:hypothetical protein